MGAEASLIGKTWLVNSVGVLLVAMLAAGCALGPPPVTSLRIAYPYEMVTVDPHVHVDGVTEAVLAADYEGLLHFEPGLQVQPWLADSWTTPDDTTWILHIREGVRFHDGTMLEPADGESLLPDSTRNWSSESPEGASDS